MKFFSLIPLFFFFKATSVQVGPDNSIDCTPVAGLQKSLDINDMEKMLYRKDPASIILLTNCIFPFIHENEDFRVIRGATFFDTVAERRAFMVEARKLEKQKDNNYSFYDLLDKTVNPEPPTSVPAGYILVKEFLGKGKYSYVSLVQRQSDGKFFAWKRKTGAQSNHGDAYRRHVNLHILWKTLNITTADMILITDNEGNESILHELVPGRTLLDEYRAKNFFKNAYSKQYQKLLDLVEKMIIHRIVMLDLNPKNIIFNGKDWDVIDSQRPKRFESEQLAFEGARDLLTEKWTQSSKAISRNRVKAFFNYFEKHRLPKILSQSVNDANVQNVVADVLDRQNDGRLVETVKQEKCNLILNFKESNN